MTKNFVEIIGFAGHDPKRNGNNKTAPVKLSLATTERWRDKTGERQERTEWHTVLFWDRLADVATAYVRKGAHILVSGSLRSRQYEEDGIKHTVWEVHARELLLLDPRTANADDESDHAVRASRAGSA
jgi:single-strand DNA-binding protein